MTLTRKKLEAIVADVIRLGFEGADSIQQLAMLDALAGKHCDRHVPPLRFNPDSTKNAAYETTLMNARATIDDRPTPVEVPPMADASKATTGAPRAHSGAVLDLTAEVDPDPANAQQEQHGHRPSSS